MEIQRDLIVALLLQNAVTHVSGHCKGKALKVVRDDSQKQVKVRLLINIILKNEGFPHASYMCIGT